MAPSRKSRSVNKRFSYVNNISPNKSRENGNTSRQRKRKLADMLGPQWKKEELERFYKAYRKHGKDWEKVAAMVHNRSVEMVEALYTMNRAYLSLPKGYSSAAGLIAMMTDHYANMEEDSNSEQETNEGIGVSRKPQKRTRGAEAVDGPSVADLLNSQLTESSYSCLSLLKKRRSVSRPWAVGKRTPRVPVSYAGDKVDGEKYVSPIRQSLKAKVDALDDDVTHKLALALTEASKGSRSLKVSQTPKLKAKTQSPRQNGARMHAGPVMTSAKLRGSLMDDGGCELPLGSTEADIGGHSGDRRALKGKKHLRKKPNEEERIDKEESIDNGLADAKEACSGTEEGEKVSAVKGNFDMEIGNKKLASSSNKSTRKKSKKVLFGQGEDPAFDALQTLADLSLRLPETPVDTESSVHAGEGKARIVAKSKVKGSHSPPGVKTTSIKTSKQGKASPHDRNTTPEAKDGTHQINDGIRKQRQKSLPFKISENYELTGTLLGDSQKSERKLLKRPERTSSSDHVRELNDSALATLKVTSPNKLNLTTKVRSRRKFSTPEPLMAKDIKSVETIGNGHFNDRALSIKEKLSNCLSCYQVRRWCVFEWFYSAIDYPWFAKKEFVEYLNHVGLGHISRLTRVEWGVIRSSLGKPRRFSEQFLKEERGKLNQYRDSVRQHYGELRAGTREGLPTDLARPLYVGQQVIALHPKTREIHDGSILTIDHSKARVQFDQSELGVEFIMDVDCMPSNPLENMPASLTEHTLTSTKIIDDLNEPKMNGQPMERKVDGYTKFASTENLENINARLQIAPSTYHVGNLLHQTKGDLSSSDTQNNIDVGKAVNAQQALNGPSVLAQIQAKEADIHALSELTRALDKKEALLAELTRLNDEVLGNQRDGENSLKDSELFKKYYAAVLLQLNEINEQVSSALFCLRQRNTYQGNSPLMWFKPMGSVGEPVGHCRSFGYSRDDSDIQETGCHVAEIVETSRTKARTMVDVAVQAMSSFKKEDSSMESIEEVIDFVNNHLSADELSMPAKRSPTTASRAYNAPASEDQLSPCTNPGTINDPVDAKLNNLFDQNNTKMPLDLIGQCVATLLMIQKCTERQFPPSDVAQVLDSAVTSLKPCCPQNLPIYAEIQKCIGIIRNQILALIPA